MGDMKRAGFGHGAVNAEKVVVLTDFKWAMGKERCTLARAPGDLGSCAVPPSSCFHPDFHLVEFSSPVSQRGAVVAGVTRGREFGRLWGPVVKLPVRVLE